MSSDWTSRPPGHFFAWCCQWVKQSNNADSCLALTCRKPWRAMRHRKLLYVLCLEASISCLLPCLEFVFHLDYYFLQQHRNTSVLIYVIKYKTCIMYTVKVNSVFVAPFIKGTKQNIYGYTWMHCKWGHTDSCVQWHNGYQFSSVCVIWAPLLFWTVSSSSLRMFQRGHRALSVVT